MLRRKTNIITIILMLGLSISSMGVPYISLCCDDQKINEILNQTSGCCNEEVKIEEISCCTELFLNANHTCKNSCEGLCFVNYSYFKLDTDQIIVIQKLFETTFINSKNIIYNNEQKQTLDFSKILSNKSPPNFGGRILIIALNKSKIPFPPIA